MNPPWLQELERTATRHRTVTIGGRQYFLCPHGRKGQAQRHERPLVPYRPGGRPLTKCRFCERSLHSPNSIDNEPGELQWSD